MQKSVMDHDICHNFRKKECQFWVSNHNYYMCILCHMSMIEWPHQVTAPCLYCCTQWRSQKLICLVSTFPIFMTVISVQLSAMSILFVTLLRFLMFPSHRSVHCVQFSAKFAVFDTLIRILMFPSYRFVHCVQLSARSTFDTLIRILMLPNHLVHLIDCHITHNKV